MIEVEIPGFRRFELLELVCDYNGTLAVDGLLHAGVRERFASLSTELRLHVLTADTFGTAREQLVGLECRLTIVPSTHQAEAKKRYVEELGAPGVVAIGNGRNDCMMLEAAALGIGVCGREGLATDALQASDICAREICDALDLLLFPDRLIATLRA